MDKYEIKQLYHEAVRKWGMNAQLIVAIEEMAELTKELVKQMRATNNNMVEEIADVEIMLEQVKQMFSLRYDVEIVKAEKLNRLKRRLEE